MKSTYKKLPRFKKLEILFEVVALITFVLTWVYFKSEVRMVIKIQYEELPREVPIEFDVNGKVVRKESKEFLYAFPGIETMAYILLSVLQFVPHRFRYKRLNHEGTVNHLRFGTHKMFTEQPGFYFFTRN